MTYSRFSWARQTAIRSLRRAAQAMMPNGTATVSALCNEPVRAGASQEPRQSTESHTVTAGRRPTTDTATVPSPPRRRP
ncbi:hypothetical protein [Streptomyces uncialis]|uniref:hypothetical protein n=1 Tax=Streptomyces uncialis TaxID=1048205 RepID=UPI003867AA70|nr:hypothetical protein OG268_00095 [Streptomyces uncialis]WST72490.1 hypothetical protein OG268_36675 [Streptomyces uncialis]